jgi:hypothetical protein
MMGERSAMERQPGALTRINRRWAEMPGEAREAIGDLLAEPYLRLSYPSAGAFAEAFDVVPGTAAFEAEWRRQATRCKEGMLTAYDPESRVYALCARGRDGALVALATMLTVRGTRETPLTEAIGDAASSVPTLQLLRFAFGPGLGLAAGETPERRIAEFGRICIRQPEELVALVMAGTLSLAQAAYVEERGFDEMFAQSYWRDQALPEPPLAYFGNMKPWMADGLARRGLDLRPLFLHDGAEPTERVLHSGTPQRGLLRAVVGGASPAGAAGDPGAGDAGGDPAAGARRVRGLGGAADLAAVSHPQQRADDRGDGESGGRLRLRGGAGRRVVP